MPGQCHLLTNTKHGSPWKFPGWGRSPLFVARIWRCTTPGDYKMEWPTPAILLQKGDREFANDFMLLLWHPKFRYKKTLGNGGPTSMFIQKTSATKWYLDDGPPLASTYLRLPRQITTKSQHEHFIIYKNSFCYKIWMPNLLVGLQNGLRIKVSSCLKAQHSVVVISWGINMEHFNRHAYHTCFTYIYSHIVNFYNSE